MIMGTASAVDPSVVVNKLSLEATGLLTVVGHRGTMQFTVGKLEPTCFSGLSSCRSLVHKAACSVTAKALEAAYTTVNRPDRNIGQSQLCKAEFRLAQRPRSCGT
jgi:hypothetical protein